MLASSRSFLHVNAKRLHHTTTLMHHIIRVKASHIRIDGRKHVPNFVLIGYTTESWMPTCLPRGKSPVSTGWRTRHCKRIAGHTKFLISDSACPANRSGEPETLQRYTGKANQKLCKITQVQKYLFNLIDHLLRARADETSAAKTQQVRRYLSCCTKSLMSC